MLSKKLTGATYSTPAHLKLHVKVPSGEEAPDRFGQDGTSVANNKTILKDGIMIKCTAIDDGYLYLSRYGKVTGSNRFSEVPVLRYEVCIFFPPRTYKWTDFGWVQAKRFQKLKKAKVRYSTTLQTGPVVEGKYAQQVIL